jgi:hypothetical protein
MLKLELEDIGDSLIDVEDTNTGDSLIDVEVRVRRYWRQVASTMKS